MTTMTRDDWKALDGRNRRFNRFKCYGPEFAAANVYAPGRTPSSRPDWRVKLLRQREAVRLQLGFAALEEARPEPSPEAQSLLDRVFASCGKKQAPRRTRAVVLAEYRAILRHTL